MGGPSEPVEIVPVDTLGLARCDLLKIDVEGMEGEVLAGATTTITRFRPVLYVENDREEKSAPLIERLLSLDYELFWHLPFLFNPENFFGQTANVFKGIVSINILGVPREAKRSADGLPSRRRAARLAIRQMKAEHAVGDATVEDWFRPPTTSFAPLSDESVDAQAERMRSREDGARPWRAPFDPPRPERACIFQRGMMSPAGPSCRRKE